MSVRRSESPHLVIAASAGSGKTFQLTSRYIRLVLEGVRPDRILASTFTRKAAAEILARVLSRIAKGALDEAGAAKLASEVQTDASRDDALAALGRLTRNLHRLQISTLDALFSRMATGLHLDVGLPPGWRIADDSTVLRMRESALRVLVGRHGESELGTLVRLLSKGDVGRKVFDSIHDSVRSHRLLWLESDPDAWEWSFRKTLSQDEVLEAIDRLRSLPPQKNGHVRNAIASFLKRVEAESWQEALNGKFCLAAVAGDTYHNVELDPALTSVVKRLVEHALSVIWNQHVGHLRAIESLLRHFDEIYRRTCYLHRSLGFEDVARTLAERLEGIPWSDIHRQLDERTDHILLDEFQDTSFVQWQIIEPMIDEVRAYGDGSRSFFCVGDRKQSIYGWRSAVPAVFDHVLQLDGMERKPLDKSWRSSPVIIDVVNRVFENLPATSGLASKYSPAVRKWHESFNAHETARVDLPGFAEVIAEAPPAVANDDEEKRSGAKSKATPIKHVRAWIAGKAVEKVASIRAVAPDVTIGVLVRKREMLARIMEGLRVRGIEASEEGGVRLDDTPIVAALLSLLRFADRPGDLISRFHVATSPLGPIVGLEGETMTAQDLVVARDVRRRLVAEGYGRTIRDWAWKLAPVCDDSSLRRLFRVVDLARAWDAQATLRPADFIAHIEATRVEDPTADRVRVMTIHGSKGLEFDWVILPELEGSVVGRPPGIVATRGHLGRVTKVSPYPKTELRSWFGEIEPAWEQYAEERISDSLSALYVALTRAVHALTIFVPARNPSGDSFAKILQGALYPGTTLEAGSVLFTSGSAEWFREVADAKRGSSVATAKEIDGENEIETGAAAEFDAWSPPELAPSRRARIRSHETPDSWSAPEVAKLSERLFLDDSHAKDIVSALARIVRKIAWIDDGDNSAEKLIAATEPISENVEREALSRRLVELLENEHVRGALLRERTIERLARKLDGGASDKPAIVLPGDLRLERGRRFTYRREDRLLDGRFDRLVILSRDGAPVCAEIIDFDTKLAPPRNPDLEANHRASARNRASLLREAGARVTKLPEERILVRAISLAAGWVIEG